ncbi:alcohol dehydrogenase [Acrocarpospora pleiomorpha]|uniref:Alcohol dehydrogenase n=1 Tax=Acrocarpospora pleiomorpha TaxID=90975 RepID=A0A5M3XAS0_9ACTN|nr:zinc-binding dehydrogenase [Acrocarpospora pleiomorpha]GES17299.1 alcohol dehydrogenase [Acrocarpospora pleiomorpha]
MSRAGTGTGASTVIAEAAVFTEPGRPLDLLDLAVRAPLAHEVRVRLAATGVCHTDQSIFTGAIPFKPPLVLGHEGAGVVDVVGSAVTGLSPGDPVILTWLTQCGSCFYCVRSQPELCETKPATDPSAPPRLTRDGDPVAQLAGVGTFSSVVVVDAAAVVRLPGDMPMTSACLVGCGVLTGIGAALNTANVRPGDVVVVLGCGGVGLNVVQGARIAGSSRIVAVDLMPEKLELARRFGASTVIQGTDPAATIESVRELTGGRGADVVFEVVGLPSTARQALELTRPGGRMCLVGAAPLGAAMDVPMYLPFVSQQKSIIGCRCGSTNIARDVSFIVERYRRGDLLLDELVGNTVPLTKINDVMDNLDSAAVARTVIDFAV